MNTRRSLTNRFVLDDIETSWASGGEMRRLSCLATPKELAACREKVPPGGVVLQQDMVFAVQL